MNTSVNDAFHGLDGADEHSLSARKACQPMKRGASSTVFMFFFMVLITSALFCWIDRVSWFLLSHSVSMLNPFVFLIIIF